MNDRKVPDDFVRQPIDEVVAVGLGAQVLQRQDGDDRSLDGRCGRTGSARGAPCGWRHTLRLAIAWADGDPRDQGHHGRYAKCRGERDQPWTSRDRRQVACERRGIRLATLGLRAVRALDDIDELRREIRSCLAQADALSTSVRLSELAKTRRPQGERPGEQVIKQNTDAVHVAPDRGLGSGEQLRREIERRAGQSRGRGVAKLQASPKVHEDDSAILSEHHVLRFDVAMEQTGAVHGGNGGT